MPPDIKELSIERFRPRAAPTWTHLLRFLGHHGVLIALMITYAIAFIDRQVLAMLQESIKHELLLSDSQLGLLTGFSFALFYALLGVPVARLADRWNRRNLISVAMIVWSGITASISFAHTFTYLLLARIGVGIGEAGVSPASCSIIADLYAPRHRAGAMCFYTTGAQIGVLFGFLLGGWLDHRFGWRMAFVIVGLPGIVVAAMLRLWVREPARGVTKGVSPSFMDGLRYLASRKTIRWLTPACALSTLVAFAPMSWAASYLIRVHHVPIFEVGVWLALGIGIGGLFGTFSSGLLVDRLGARDLRWYVWYPAIISAVVAPLLWFAFAASDGMTARLLFLVPFAFASAYAGIILSVVNQIAPPQLRATASALYFLITNIFGIGLGTWLIGIASDLLTPAYGATAIQYALLTIVPAMAVIASILYVFAARTLRDDVTAASNGQS
jgi:predicted MFS family arabinose efflux permease